MPPCIEREERANRLTQPKVHPSVVKKAGGAIESLESQGFLRHHKDSQGTTRRDEKLKHSKQSKEVKACLVSAAVIFDFDRAKAALKHFHCGPLLMSAAKTGMLRRSAFQGYAQIWTVFMS